MEKMIDLKDLLKHEIVDLYSVESQIIEALPNMIEKAVNPSLKKALSEHLSITEKQKERLDEIKGLIIDQSEEEGKNTPGFFARIFGGASEEKCKGMEGILEEGKKMLAGDMSPEVMDAAIIAATQKVEHYEICGYGTALAYARELKLTKVADLLGQSLDEEYDADDNLTFLAVGHLNLEAEFAGGDLGDDQPLKPTGNSSNRAGNNNRSKQNSMNVEPTPVPVKKQSSTGSNRAAAKTAAAKKTSASTNKAGSSKSAPGKSTNGKKNQGSKSGKNQIKAQKVNSNGKNSARNIPLKGKAAAKKSAAARKPAPTAAPKKAAAKKFGSKTATGKRQETTTKGRSTAKSSRNSFSKNTASKKSTPAKMQQRGGITRGIAKGKKK